MLQILLLQPGDPDVLVGTRHVPRPRGARRSRRPVSAKPAFHAFPAGAGADQLYISSIRATGVKESNRRIHRETRSAYCLLPALDGLAVGRLLSNSQVRIYAKRALKRSYTEHVVSVYDILR